MAMMWRPGKVSRGVLALVTCISVMGYLLVESLPKKTRNPFYREKIQAAKIMAKGMDIIKQAKISIFGIIDTRSDPNATGMIGSGLTAITSNEGSLVAKQTSANPNFAAVMVDMFKTAGLKKGDIVAMGFSGSFPSMNMASLIAAETLELQPIVISSAAASRWGANDPQLPWLEMERLLFEHGIIKHRTVAASMGGEQDRGVGLPPDGVKILRSVIKKNGIEFIDPPDLVSSFDQRMNIYKEYAAGKPIKCYVNVGGGAGSVGSALIKKMFSPGLNMTMPKIGRLRDSMLTRMSKNAIPVINIYYIKKLAIRYGLPVKPDAPLRVGEGGIYASMGYNMILVWGVSAVLVLLTFLLLRMDLKHYMLRVSTIMAITGSNDSSPPDQNNGHS